MDAATRGAIASTLENFLAEAARGGWRGFVENGRLSAGAEAFLRGFHEDIAAEEMGDLGLEDLLACAHDFWLWRGECAADSQCVRIRPARGAGGRDLGRDLLEIVGPDMPFLVDSVMGELSEQGVAALAMFHPIVPGAGARVSMIQVHAPRLALERARGLHEGVCATLADVRAAVADYPAMRAHMLACADVLAKARSNAAPEEISEAVELLRWLADNRFTYLGARDYAYARDRAGALLTQEPTILDNSGLGLLRDPERYVLRTSAEPLMITPALQRQMDDPTPLVVAKSTLRSRVHRRTAADYIGVKRYDAKGAVVGETRFVGLFTTEAFTDPAHRIPSLRKKIDWVVNAAGAAPGGHKAKALRHLMETYPREELWQIEKEELLETARGIIHLLDRPRPRAFVRRDRFGRFVSALVYLPKERFNSQLRIAVGQRLVEKFGGAIESFFPLLSEGPLARVHYMIVDIDRERPAVDMAALNDEIVSLTRTWEDNFLEGLACEAHLDEGAREEAKARFAGAFSAGYRERYSAANAVHDVIEIMSAREDEVVRARAYRLETDPPSALRCKFYVRDDVLALSTTVPILEKLGLFVEAELNYEVHLGAYGAHSARVIHIHEVEARSDDGAEIDLNAAGGQFEEAFAAIWTGAAESDGFNRLILKLGVGWREASLIRALARYRQQSGLDPNQAIQEEAAGAYPHIVSLILALFRVRFDPSLPEDLEARRDWAGQIQAKIDAALNEAPSLDHDRALRRIALLVNAITRTSYYQRGADGALKAQMAFKIVSGELEHLPAPKPYREIWVASPRVEGVHLRMGPVARGGLRWSDRRDDFRTEILDLVKAQQVKNAIIVPVGAKGGFYPKRLPARGAPGYLDEGKEAYKTFLRGLLDITDTIEGESVRAPADVVRWDGDDPYLVVAADKGTATFSDIANSISAEYGFWLGDAFASGGSAGYDHKAMGITARGAWEAVKRHFREMGKNIQETEFTVIGVGDMSGDVFGNGMLLSKHIRLIAAFDHRDIFIDPMPDPARSWAERNRLFALARSSWADYDKNLISQGGGVFSRSAKAIPISREISDITGIGESVAAPNDIIAALLKAECELLWFGGIGTYIKARAESHADVGDKSNDGVRVNADEVRAKVIGEGANLGVTQLGRIEFARAGRAKGAGRINTDAVDNSAGVDTSDHEVNIKILLAEAIRSGALTVDARDGLLAEMTNDVAQLVLRDNIDQTLALSVAEAAAVADLDSHERFMRRLENAGKLSRRVEQLPNSAAIAELRARGEGLSRPELSKLIAYAKIDLFDALTASAAPDDEAFAAPLVAYFPQQLARFGDARARHRLRREIIATSLAGDIIDLCGPSFVVRVCEAARVSADVVACAFEAARRIFGIDELTARIEALENSVGAGAQIAMHREIATAMRRYCTYLSRKAGFGAKAGGARILDVVACYSPAVAAMREAPGAFLTDAAEADARAREALLVGAGAPAALAAEAAHLRALGNALEIADIAAAASWPVAPAGLIYREIGARFGLDTLRAEAFNLKLDQHWDRLAVLHAVEDLFEDQQVLARAAVAQWGPPREASHAWAAHAVDEWLVQVGEAAQVAREAYAELAAHGAWTFAKIMLVTGEVNALANAQR